MLYGKLVMTFPSKKRFVGTAWLYNDSTLLTCAHNLFSPANGGRAEKVEWFPTFSGK